MEAYVQKIREEGVETLNQFLLLLKEETIMSKKRNERRNLSKDDFDLLLEAAKKMTSEEALKSKEFLMQPDKIIKLKTKLDNFLELDQSQLLASNAFFIYLFALFDKLILEVNNSSPLTWE